jgi:prepilin-type N-terminal cleavage/methylation domain-containing protein
MPVRRLLARVRSQSGFTLVEMLVAATVGSVVMLAVFSLLDNSLKQSTGVNARIDSTQRGRNAMEIVTRELRSQVCFGIGAATPVALTYADAYKVTFYAFSGSGTFKPDRRTLWWDTNSNSLKETIEAGVGTPVTSFAAGTTRVIATEIVPTKSGSTSLPIFTYFKEDGTPFSSAAPVPAASVPQIAVTKIAFQTNTGVIGAQSKNSNTVQNTQSSYQGQVFARTADPNGLAGTTDPTC